MEIPVGSRRLQRSRHVRIGAVAALLLVATAACRAPPVAPSKVPLPGVEAVAVRPVASAAWLSATGQLERGREMTLAFRIPGVIIRMAVDEGDQVVAGQILAAVDPTGVAAAEARALVEVARARRDLARDQALFDKGFVSRQRLDDRISAVAAAQAGVNGAAFDRRWSRLVSPASGVVLQRLAFDRRSPPERGVPRRDRAVRQPADRRYQDQVAQ